MSIVDDWLRQHTGLTLSRNQREDLERLIDEEIDDWGEDKKEDDFDEDEFAAKWFLGGAKAMRKEIVEYFNENADACGKTLGLDTALGVIADAIDRMETPEVPEEIDKEETT